MMAKIDMGTTRALLSLDKNASGQERFSVKLEYRVWIYRAIVPVREFTEKLVSTDI